MQNVTRANGDGTALMQRSTRLVRELENAIASAALEGIDSTPAKRALVEQAACGEISHVEFLDEAERLARLRA